MAGPSGEPPSLAQLGDFRRLIPPGEFADVPLQRERERANARARDQEAVKTRLEAEVAGMDSAAVLLAIRESNQQRGAVHDRAKRDAQAVDDALARFQRAVNELQAARAQADASERALYETDTRLNALMNRLASASTWVMHS